MTNPNKTKCRTETKRLIEKGKINKTPCEVCDNPIVECHHNDYNDPKDVKWLCKKHHKELHKSIGTLPGFEGRSYIAIVCDEDYKKAVEEYAANDERSLSDYCRRAVTEKMRRDRDDRFKKDQ